MSHSEPPKRSEFEVLAVKLDAVREDIAEIKDVLDSKLVTKDEFEPIKRLVYGVVGLVLSSVVAAVLALVLRS